MSEIFAVLLILRVIIILVIIINIVNVADVCYYCCGFARISLTSLRKLSNRTSFIFIHSLYFILVSFGYVDLI